MNGSDSIKLFFSKMKCSNCDHFFNEEDITILRDEGDYIVARIYCSRCGKNVGIALLGLDREMMKKTLEASDTESISGIKEPITYDDVIDAHAFFSSLGDDWTKFIPQEYKN